MQKSKTRDLEALSEKARRLKLHGLGRELARRQLKAHPNDFGLLLELAGLEETFCCYRRAQAAIDKAEKACPPGAMRWVWAQRGHLSKAMGDFKTAGKHYLAAHRLAPEEAAYLIYAGSAAFAAGRTRRAIGLTTRATRCTKGCIDEAWFNLGGYWMALRRYREARTCYLKTLEIDPDYRMARTRLEDVTQILAL